MIRFELPRSSRARLRVYDTLGRAVRVLVDSELPAAIHVLEWDGRDDRGRDVASGTYDCQLEAGGQRLTKKLQLIR
jgi:flagellar hook assembly protein FlgD